MAGVVGDILWSLLPLVKLSATWLSVAGCVSSSSAGSTCGGSLGREA
jgi:hypothetical protein